MDRRAFLSIGATAAGALALPALGAQPRRAGRPAAGAPRGLVWDAMGELRPEYDDALLRAMLASGMDAITITLCDPKPEGDEAFRLAMDALLAHDRWLATRPDRFVKATRVADVDRAQRAGKLAVWYLYQNSVHLGENLDRIDLFARLGVRSVQLTYNTRNQVGVGCWETGGLTPFGREAIARMNARGVLIDLSHANMQTMAEAVAASTMPVIVSHTGCMAVHQNRRNTTDANLRAVAERGGVVGICQMRPFLTTARGAEALPAYWAHLRHAIDVCGVEHVAIGSDRDHRVITLSPEYLAELKREEGAQVVENELPYFIDALNGPGRMDVVRRGLEGVGLRAAEVERVLGGNLRRLYAEVVG
jgi:membrane dipeptidase